MVAVLESQASGGDPKDARRSAAQAADVLAMARAALDGVERALRSAPEVQASRVMSRWPLSLEDLLLELEPTADQTPLRELAPRLGVSVGQVRSTALRLQRMGMVKVTSDGVAMTSAGRSKMARLDAARSAVLRRLAERLEPLSSGDSDQLLALLVDLVGGIDRFVNEQTRGGPTIEGLRLSR
ncbi:MAG: hypothetical protein RIT81_23230 [Deltaproteobacteria bacterium]